MSSAASRSLSLIGLAAAALLAVAACTPGGEGPGPESGPTSPPDRYAFTEIHMGVPVRIVVYARDRDAAEHAVREGFGRIRALDAILSDYRPDSELTALSARAGVWTPVSGPLFAVLSRARELARLTDGAFDPTLGPLTSFWREARRSGRLPAAARLAEARERTGWHLLQLDAEARAVRLAVPGMRLDLGGIAKGYVLDEAAAAVRSAGAPRHLLEAGGDIVVGDAPPDRDGWEIAVAGAEPAFVRRAAALANAALATSGASAQFVEIDGVRYSHVIDPATGLGLTHGHVVHVIAPDGATADALATALGVAEAAAAHAILAQFPDVMALCFESSMPTRESPCRSKGGLP